MIRFQAESDIAAKEKNAEQLQDELAAQDESISKLSKEKKNLEEAKQVSNPENIGQTGESERESEVCEGPKIFLSSLPIFSRVKYSVRTLLCSMQCTRKRLLV